ncbi:hypothetical protein PFISCL1PPCAC_404, partial [Pristionchus fissidentatus]
FRMFSVKLVTFFALLECASAMRDQSIAVTGKFLCGDKPAAEMRVKLWEKDSGPVPDEQLDEDYTDADGRFTLSGGTVELTPIDPILKVYHDCDDVLPGYRKVKFVLPKSAITQGPVPTKTYDIGVINLETIFKEEERELVVSKRSLRFRRGGVNEEMDDTEIIEQEKQQTAENEDNKRKKESSSESASSEERFF